jgi:urocanate hydratase
MDKGAQENKLVVGSTSSIYLMQKVVKLPKLLIRLLPRGDIGTVVLGRIIDVSGTDSPYRETSIYMTDLVYR